MIKSETSKPVPLDNAAFQEVGSDAMAANLGGLGEPDWLEVARLVLLSRKIDQIEEEQLAPQGKMKLQLSSAGHELAQVLLGLSLNHPWDAAGIYYRSRPFLLASGLSAQEALAASLARTGSPSEGRDVGVVFSMPRRNRATVLPTSGNVGTQYTPAAGWAQALQYRQRVLGEKTIAGAVAVAAGGDGSVAANGFWSAVTIATTLKLPMLFFIEDNGFGISVPSDYQTPHGNIATNLASFGNLELVEASGTEPLQAWQAIASSLDHVRSGKGPCLLKVKVPRLSGHIFSDKQKYKSVAQLDDDAAHDPLVKLKEFLYAANILAMPQLDELEQNIERDVKEALVAAEKAEPPPRADVLKHMFFESDPIQGGLRPEKANLPSVSNIPRSGGAVIDLREAIRCTLEQEMRENERMIVFGEDVGALGGIHGVTRTLQDRLGADRVFDTSLSEEGIIGRSIGMAVCGLLPVPELQFRKYADAAHEQITDVGTLRWRTAGKFAAPMVVRIPVGCGRKNGDPWHSMSGEAIYAHLLGWRIAIPSNAEDAVGLLRTALRGDDPTFFLEHRALLVNPLSERNDPGDDFCLPFGAAATLTQGDRLTVITWGEMVYRCVEAAESFAGLVTVLDLRTIVPWDQERVLESVRQTGKALVVHEDTLTAGFAGEIIATIASESFDTLKAPLERLCTADCPIPYDVGLMAQVVPSVDQIRSKIEYLLAY